MVSATGQVITSTKRSHSKNSQYGIGANNVNQLGQSPGARTLAGKLSKISNANSSDRNQASSFR